MMSQEKNDEITLVGAGQPAGQLLRHYWMPAALAVELDGPRPVAPVRLMGEDLVLFRREDKTLGLMSRFCVSGTDTVRTGWKKRLTDAARRCCYSRRSPPSKRIIAHAHTHPPPRRNTHYRITEQGNGIWTGYKTRGEGSQSCIKKPAPLRRMRRWPVAGWRS